MSLLTERQRGEAARRLLDEPLLADAFDMVETGLRRQWEVSGESETEARERLWQMLRLLGRVRGLLTEAMETGKLADAQLAAIEAAAKSEEARR